MNKNDEVIKELLKQVEKQKKELGVRERASLVTNGLFVNGNNSNDILNINTVNDVNILIRATRLLIKDDLAHKKACELLEIDLVENDRKPCGYTFDEWITDFKTRIRIIEWNKRKRKLSATTKKLNTLMSTDARTESELDTIRAELNI